MGVDGRQRHARGRLQFDLFLGGAGRREPWSVRSARSGARALDDAAFTGGLLHDPLHATPQSDGIKFFSWTAAPSWCRRFFVVDDPAANFHMMLLIPPERARGELMASSIDWRHASSFIVPVLVFLLILRRSLRERKVRTTRMWLYPVILGAAALYTMAHEPIPGPAAIASFIGAAIAGAGLGYLRARHQQFTLDAATSEISSKATPLGTILIGAFFVVRFGLEFF